jgi:hypothetical protein
MEFQKAKERVHGGYWYVDKEFEVPQIYQDIQEHMKCYLRCQQRKLSTEKPTSLKPLPILEQPNLRIYTDLFGPIIAAESNKKFILCDTAE